MKTIQDRNCKFITVTVLAYYSIGRISIDLTLIYTGKSGDL